VVAALALCRYSIFWHRPMATGSSVRDRTMTAYTMVRGSPRTTRTSTRWTTPGGRSAPSSLSCPLSTGPRCRKGRGCRRRGAGGRHSRADQGSFEDGVACGFEVRQLALMLSSRDACTDRGGFDRATLKVPVDRTLDRDFCTPEPRWLEARRVGGAGLRPGTPGACRRRGPGDGARGRPAAARAGRATGAGGVTGGTARVPAAESIPPRPEGLGRRELDRDGLRDG
jgi:hypothetical protein